MAAPSPHLPRDAATNRTLHAKRRLGRQTFLPSTERHSTAGSAVLSLPDQWKGEAEEATAPRGIINPDLTTMGGDNPPDNRQAEAGTALLA